jgi:small conductance mechanosensitive channel
MLAEFSNLNLEDLFQRLAPLVVQYALDLLVAVVVLVVGLFVAAWAYRATLRLFGRLNRVDQTFAPVLATVVRYGILILVLVVVLAQFGVQTTSIIAVLGAAGIAVALALQGTLANIAAGIMLLALRPFRIGEYIDAEGIAGTVETIGLFTTDLRTAEGIYVSTPNNQLWNRTIINYNRKPTRRLDVPVGIGYGDDLDRAREALLELAGQDMRVLSEPKAIVFVDALGDNAVNIVLRVWVGTVDYWDLKWDLTRGAKVAMDEAGITIPFPQRDVHLYRQDTAGSRDGG